jgi:hypothetical protein
MLTYVEPFAKDALSARTNRLMAIARPRHFPCLGLVFTAYAIAENTNMWSEW